MKNPMTTIGMIAVCVMAIFAGGLNAGASTGSGSNSGVGVGSRARPPYGNQPVQVFVVQKGQLRPSEGDTIIERSLAKYATQYGVRISQKNLAGYILDLDQDDRERNDDGFDLGAHLDEPFFAPWFHNPMPEIPESQRLTEALWTYATTGKEEESGFVEKLSYAVALTHIDHVFFPLKKFSSGFYFNPKSGEATDEGFESVLHEALHIWHFRNHQAVTRLLKSPGSYFDRVEMSERICPGFLEVSMQYNQKLPCGHADKDEAIGAVLSQTKWPQRYGARTNRVKALRRQPTDCVYYGRATTLEGRSVCLLENEESGLGDLHAFDNEYEYFAILMQLYVLSRADFDRVATPEEARFAQDLFRNEFGPSSHPSR